MSAPKVVIVGAGFAGLECAKAFKGEPVEVLLVDRQNHHLFQPLLYQVASAGLAAPEIAHPIRSVFFKQDNVEVLMDEVVSIDLERRLLRTAGREQSYDYLVLAMGVRTGYFGHPEWEPFARGLKSLDDATAMRRDVLHAFERAEACPDPGERRRLMSVVVIGGGPTGVELAGAFAELARHVLRRDFRHINTSEARIHLVEAQDRLLTMYHPSLSDYTRRTLERMGVTVHLGASVTDLREGEVVLADRTLRAATLVWAAGVEAPALTRTLGVETDRAGRLLVETDLSLPGHPEVFAVGDLANCTDQAGRRVPGLCPAAMQMGRHAAAVILGEIRGGRPAHYPVRLQFRYFDKGSMATIGRSHAVAESRGMRLEGFPAWLMWLFIHLLFLVGYRNRLAVLLQWAYSYLRYRRGARIITQLVPPLK